jgi:two-component system nitrate/nitrite response regulator NarL
MGKLVTTLIVEPRSLVCQALVSLMESHSYHVVGGIASTADIDGSVLVADAPKLVILGALPMEGAAIAASCIRELWPETKIVHLFEGESSVDFQALLASAIDGCIPLSASPDTLIGTLQQIIAADFKMLVLRKEAASRSRAALPSAHQPITPVVTSKEARNGSFDGSFSNKVRHGLSEREEQILKDLVKGLSNKIIARKLDIAEATVKVHMKSILRKIRVTNRTQGAIWALENGYGADSPHLELPRLEAIEVAHAATPGALRI